MSQFTATIVHDFRNILSAMQSGLRMIVRKTDNLEIVQYARLIEGAVERGTKLSNRLLSFAKEDGAEIAPVGLRELCDDMAYLLQQAAGPQVEVDVQISEGSLTAQVNRDQLELALVNLVVNARDAMHGSGRIVIAASQRGSDIEISVTDTGPGIPAELRSDLFKPFFTTKAGNGGTGLGLAQVAGMASQAKGAVSIEDAPGGGAEFLIRLPCAEADSTVSAKFT
nr:HAMP domain-containing sensor histidine kinase [Loktanella sp. M215]